MYHREERGEGGRERRGEYIGEMKWISMHAPPQPPPPPPQHTAQQRVDIKFQVLSKLRSAG